MIKAVLFDLDETLILRGEAIRAFVRDQYRRYAAVLRVTEPEYLTSFLRLDKNGSAEKGAVYRGLIAALGATAIEPEMLLADYRERYPSFSKLRPGALELLAKLHAEGHKTGLITNGGTAVLNGKIDAVGIRSLLDTVLVSETIGLRKPDPSIFRLATSNLGMEAENVLFVGDNPEADIGGAIGAGMKAAWCRNGANWPAHLTPRADLEIDQMDEISTYLGLA